jgi:hypothetical protein
MAEDRGKPWPKYKPSEEDTATESMLLRQYGKPEFERTTILEANARELLSPEDRENPHVIVDASYTALAIERRINEQENEKRAEEHKKWQADQT